MTDMEETRRPLKEVMADALAEYKNEYPTVRAAAAALDLSSTTVYDYLQGYKKNPTPQTLRRIASMFPKYAADFYAAVGQSLPSDLLEVDCPPYCDAANAIAAKLGVTKEEAITRAVERYAEQLTVAA